MRLKIIETKYKSTNEISKNLNTQNTDMNIDPMSKRMNLSFDNVLDVIGSFGQEGLGPIKWWQN